MALNFPDNPTLGETYTDNTSGFSYEWDGVVWRSYSVPSVSNIKLIDNISGLFNNVLVSFPLTVNGQAVLTATSKQLILSIGGVIQNPSIDFNVVGSNIVFTTAPTAGLSFFGTLLGGAQIEVEYSSTAGISSYAASAGISTVSQGLTGTPNVVVGNATITGDLTVQGSTTTIDTINLIIEDKNIGIGSTSSASNVTANGGGITIFGGPDGDKSLTYNNTKKAFETNIPWSPDESRSITGSEKLVRSDGNTVNLVYNSSSGANVGFATNPTGDITLNVTGIPTSSDFDNQITTFAVIVNNTGTARTCTSVTLNGVSKTIKWIGGSLSAALSGVTTSNGYSIFSFTGINTVGSASTTLNYDVLGVLSGGFW